jgi:hypothetical protein
VAPAWWEYQRVGPPFLFFNTTRALTNAS